MNISKFFIWKFLEGLNLVYAVKIIYLMSKGITAPQLALYASITAISSLVLEIPTGFIADKFSRKLSVALGFLVKGLAYVAVVFVNDFYSLIPVALLLGLGSSLLSGSAESLIFDELKNNDQEDDFLKTSSRGTSVMTVSGAVGTFIGPLIYIVNQQLPFIATGMVLVILAFYVLTIDEKGRSNEMGKNIKVFDGIKNVFKLRPVMVMAIVDVLMLVFVNVFYNVLYFPKIVALGLPIQYLGILDAVNLLLMTAMLLVLPRLKPKTDRMAVIGYTLLVGLIFVGFGNTGQLVLAVIFGVGFDLAWSARKHVVPSIVNQYFSPKDRAISLSSLSFISNLGAAILLPLATHVFNISYYYTLIPLLLIAILVLFYPSAKEGEKMVE